MLALPVRTGKTPRRKVALRVQMAEMEMPAEPAVGPRVQIAEEAMVAMVHLVQPQALVAQVATVVLPAPAVGPLVMLGHPTPVVPRALLSPAATAAATAAVSTAAAAAAAAATAVGATKVEVAVEGDREETDTRFLVMALAVAVAAIRLPVG